MYPTQVIVPFLGPEIISTEGSSPSRQLHLGGDGRTNNCAVFRNTSGLGLLKNTNVNELESLGRN